MDRRLSILSELHQYYVKEDCGQREGSVNLSILSELHREEMVEKRVKKQWRLSILSELHPPLHLSAPTSQTWLSILSELHLWRLRLYCISATGHFQFFLSCIRRTIPHPYPWRTVRTFQFFLSCIRPSRIHWQPQASSTFNSFWVASELFYSGGVYMFNVYFYQEVCKTVLALKFTRWKLLKLPNWESSRNSLFWVGNFSRNLFLK